MAPPDRPPPHDPDARHTPGWYRQSFGADPARPGAPLMLRCDGGPLVSRLETFPPPIEVAVPGGVYVLVDDGPVHRWHYQFVSDA